MVPLCKKKFLFSNFFLPGIYMISKVFTDVFDSDGFSL